VKGALEDLTKASHKMAEELYKSGAAGQPGAEAGAAPPPPGTEGGAEKKGGDDVVDAEYEEAPRN
jgi:molecular chaperone DnaK